MPSAAVEQYLKALWYLEQGRAPSGPGVNTQELATRLKVKAASVTKMIKRLAAWQLVQHIPYQGFKLTEKGNAETLKLIRRHRLLESFLVESLGLGWSQAHHEALLLEHGLSQELETIIAEALGHPERDPHGHPIPDREGKMPTSSARPLSTLSEGTYAEIEQLDDHDSEILNWLLLRGLLPGQNLKVTEKDPFDSSITVELDELQHRISQKVAAAVLVKAQKASPAVEMSQMLVKRTLRLSED